MAIHPIAARLGFCRTTCSGRVRSLGERTHARSRWGRIKRRLVWFALSLLTATALLTLYATWKIHQIAQSLPSVSSIADIHLSPATQILSQDGELLALFETQYRRPVALNQIAPAVIDATIATEDSRFYQHSGLDWRAIGRALWSNLRHGNAQGQGASTLTQQLARNLYLTPDKTLTRKIQEALLARKIEETYSKSDILEAYLNTVYYGSGSYGIEAAARTYFAKSADRLSLGEAALLAGLPQRPDAYAPNQHRSAALQRRDVVLHRMVETGKITQEQAEQARREPISIQPFHVRSDANWRAPYFVQYVLSQLKDRYGAEFLFSGAKVVTTLDWSMQQAAERTLQQGLKRGWGPTTGALVCLDPRSGAIRALVGGADFKQDQFNAATQGIRQPGSAFKPIVYACAFDQRLCDLTTVLEDHKLVYPRQPHDWVVHNYDDRYRGSVTLLDALKQSINTIAVQVGDKAGPLQIIDCARELGISTPMEPGLPLALGASGVHPLELCSAYTAFANNGVRYDPTCFRSIRDRSDKEIFGDQPETRVHPACFDSMTRDEINVALREVVLNGTGAAAASIPDAHGKTGTTSHRRDAWFVGYTSDLTTLVWMARARKETGRAPDGTRTERTVYLPMEGATGGHLCAPVWRDF
ncbi:MAG TPA: PBP1A family penicillin-binding protein, partial [Chthonomonadaceae bacterium]|nr:PBP1A family penicillin-binding protein [Chthonomonadaceae bacterium]